MKPRISPRLRQAALNALPKLEPICADIGLLELLMALEQEMGLTPGSSEPWDHAKLKKMEADWIEAKIRSRDPAWTAPALRPGERGRDVQWSTLWMNMLLEVMKANKAIARLQKQKGNLILQLERERQKLPPVQGVLTTNVHSWPIVSFSP